MSLNSRGKVVNITSRRRYRESTEETRTRGGDRTERAERSSLSVAPPPFSTWLLCLLSQVTLRLETDSISAFQCLVTFGVHQLRLDANHVLHLFVSPGFTQWNNLHQSLPPLGLFFYPKKQPTASQQQFPEQWFE